MSAKWNGLSPFLLTCTSFLLHVAVLTRLKHYWRTVKAGISASFQALGETVFRLSLWNKMQLQEFCRYPLSHWESFSMTFSEVFHEWIITMFGLHFATIHKRNSWRIATKVHLTLFICVKYETYKYRKTAHYTKSEVHSSLLCNLYFTSIASWSIFSGSNPKHNHVGNLSDWYFCKTPLHSMLFKVHLF